MPTAPPIDRVTLGILSHYFRAAAEMMGYTIERTAHTTFIKESQDFATGLVSPTGEHFAYSAAVGSQNFVGTECAAMIDALAPWHEGDIGIANCPYLTEGMSTHLPDYHLLKPVFADGKLIAFAWAFIHSSDMGGIVAGSILPSAYELFQEGLRIPPKKLFRRGVVQDDVKDFLLANVRIPDGNWGDLNAVAAALGMAEQRIHHAVGKWGRDTVEAGREALIGYAEERARALIAAIPDGVYEFCDYLEDDVVSDMPVRVKMTVAKEGANGLHIDFTGSDPQLGSAFNLPTGGRRHPFLCMGLLGYFRTVDPAIPVNGGLLRPLRMTAPAGSVVNCSFPAAVGVRFALAQMIYGVMQGILAQALPDAVPAAGAGQVSILAVSVLNVQTGRRHISVVQPMAGGSGGRPGQDGVEGCDFSLGGLANTPTESIENEVPILVREYSAIPDSGGPGLYRGGVALRLDFEVFHPDTIVTARGMERFRFQPWGLHGGRPGAAGDSYINPGRADERRAGKIDMLRLNAGDVFSVRTPAGGGRGDPLVRSVDKVLTDVRDGLATHAGVRVDYGVVIAGDAVDAEATLAERKRLKASRQADAKDTPATTFDFGHAREEHEWLVPPRLADSLASLLFTLPVGLRYQAKQRMFEQVRAHAPSGGIDPETLQKLWQSALRSLGMVRSLDAVAASPVTRGEELVDAG